MAIWAKALACCDILKRFEFRYGMYGLLLVTLVLLELGTFGVVALSLANFSHVIFWRWCDDGQTVVRLLQNY